MKTLLMVAALAFGGLAQAGVVPTHHTSVVVKVRAAKPAPRVRYVTRRVNVRVPIAHRTTVWRTTVHRSWVGRTEVTVTRRTPTVRTTYTYQLRPRYVRVAIRL